jgi:hypothetical protein
MMRAGGLIQLDLAGLLLRSGRLRAGVWHGKGSGQCFGSGVLCLGITGRA